MEKKENQDSQKEIKIVKETNYSYQVNPVEKMIIQRKVKSKRGEGRIQLAKRMNRKTDNVEMKFEVSDKRKKQELQATTKSTKTAKG